MAWALFLALTLACCVPLGNDCTPSGFHFLVLLNQEAHQGLTIRPQITGNPCFIGAGRTVGPLVISNCTFSLLGICVSRVLSTKHSHNYGGKINKADVGKELMRKTSQGNSSGHHCPLAPHPRAQGRRSQDAKIQPLSSPTPSAPRPAFLKNMSPDVMGWTGSFGKVRKP